MWFCKDNLDSNESVTLAPDWVKGMPVWIRLESQITWYDKRSKYCQRCYKSLKFVQIILAVAIPIVIHLKDDVWKWIVSLAAAFMAISEACQHMNQYSTLWVMYRSTAERLKHEKYLFLSSAGPYRDFDDAERLMLLAERVEEHVSSEHANWFTETRKVITESQKAKPVTRQDLSTK